MRFLLAGFRVKGLGLKITVANLRPIYDDNRVTPYGHTKMTNGAKTPPAKDLALLELNLGACSDA